MIFFEPKNYFYLNNMIKAAKVDKKRLSFIEAGAVDPSSIRSLPIIVEIQER